MNAPASLPDLLDAPMEFASDNTGPAHPEVLRALAAANEGAAPGYGADRWSREVVERVRATFEAPEAAVHLGATGTAANSLALATLGRPWQTAFCTEMAHVHEDECNAPEFFSGGMKLTPVPAPSAKLTPEALRAAMLREETRGVHGPQRGPVTITQATEKGTVYAVAEVAAVAAVAREFGQPLHMDGARFANALVATNASPADMTWRAGVDALTFGGTKNGLLGVEAVVLFDPRHAWEFELRRKRAGHLASKHRYLAAQMLAYLDGDLWLRSARAANESLARLVAGLRDLPGCEVVWEPQANLAFLRLPRRTHARLQGAGAHYYLWDGSLEGDPDEPVTGRLVCDWSTPPQSIDRFLALAAS
jgi:threonine aldolase